MLLYQFSLKSSDMSLTQCDGCMHPTRARNLSKICKDCFDILLSELPTSDGEMDLDFLENEEPPIEIGKRKKSAISKSSPSTPPQSQELKEPLKKSVKLKENLTSEQKVKILKELRPLPKTLNEKLQKTNANDNNVVKTEKK